MSNPGPQTPKTDEELMRAYQSGAVQAFAELYRRHSGRVYAYLSRRLSKAEEADEVFQATFLKMHHSRHRFDFKYPFAQWLYVITKTVLLDHLRKQGRSIPIADGADVSQIPGSPTLKSGEGLEILRALNPEQRRVVEMRILEESSYEEIAAKLGRKEAAVRQLLSRALRKLKLVSTGGDP